MPLPTPTPTVLTVAQDAHWWTDLWKAFDLWLVNFFAEHTGLLAGLVTFVFVFFFVIRPATTSFIKAYYPKDARPPWANGVLAAFGALYHVWTWLWNLTPIGKLVGLPSEDDKSGTPMILPPAQPDPKAP